MKLMKLCVPVCLAGLLWAGCNTTQQTVAYKAETATDLAVTTAMVGWGAYVATEHPGTNAEQTVLNAFEATKTAELAVVDATAATNTTPLATAQTVLSESQAALLKIISIYTNQLPELSIETNTP
jgi:hypothetical protein